MAGKIPQKLRHLAQLHFQADRPVPVPAAVLLRFVQESRLVHRLVITAEGEVGGVGGFAAQAGAVGARDEDGGWGLF